jgi:hypothetical protein
MTRHTVKMENGNGQITFGEEGYVLHAFRPGAPRLPGGRRTVEIEGYVLPEGEDAAEQERSLSVRCRRLRRIAADADGFLLTADGKTIRLASSAAPEFSEEPPFAAGDAAFFTVRAESGEGSEAYFAAPAMTAGGQGGAGRLTFPLVLTAGTVLGQIGSEGTVWAENPGDVPCGFTARVTAAGGSVSAVTLRLGERSMTVAHVLAAGESFALDTNAGKKDVTADGASILGETDWRSDFFSLMPGENAIRWESTGDGSVRLALCYAPLYL